MGLVQTSSEATGSWSLSPLILVGTPSAIIPELAFSRAEHSRHHSDVAKYIFDIILFINYCLCIDFYYLSAWCGCWFVVYIRRFIYKFLCVSFWLHGCCREWEGGTVNQVNHTCWVAVVTPTDRPKSVCNCCLIELICGVVCVVTLPFWHFCWWRGFFHRPGSDLLLFV